MTKQLLAAALQQQQQRLEDASEINEGTTRR
jgi:hypothetical protein